MGAGYVYVMTNPAFPDLVKIGYADDPERRVEELSRSEGLPFAFRLHCTLEVPERLADKDVHDIIDMLNPSLRVSETVNGKRRVREFFRMSAEDAGILLKRIAAVCGARERLKPHAPDADPPADTHGDSGLEERPAREDAPSGVPAEPQEAPAGGGGTSAAGDGDASMLHAEIERRVRAYGGLEVEQARTLPQLAFYVPGRPRFLAAARQKNRVKLYLRTAGMALHDPKMMTVPNKSKAPGTERLAFVHNMAELEDAMLLIRQCYEAVKA